MDLSEIGVSPYRHPWELSRKDIFSFIVKLQRQKSAILDIGCGDGFFTEKLAEINGVKEVVGIDTAIKNEKINTNSNVSFYSDINKVQDKKFDIIIFMDVLEHVANDSEFLAYYKKFLNEGGVIIISVPAYQKLFSVHDVALKHFRRYSREKLQKTIIKAGYKINYMSDFYASLLFARFLTLKKSIGISSWKYSETNLITHFIRMALDIDFVICLICYFCKIRLKGLSIFAVIE